MDFVHLLSVTANNISLLMQWLFIVYTEIYQMIQIWSKWIYQSDWSLTPAPPPIHLIELHVFVWWEMHYFLTAPRFFIYDATVTLPFVPDDFFHTKMTKWNMSYSTYCPALSLVWKQMQGLLLSIWWSFSSGDLKIHELLWLYAIQV